LTARLRFKAQQRLAGFLIISSRSSKNIKCLGFTVCDILPKEL
jgi:hypothetical protein